MVIRDATEKDAESLLSIYAYYVTETAVSFETAVPSLADFEDRIKNIRRRYPYLVAVDGDGSVIGYAYANVFKSRAAYDWSVEGTIYLRRDVRKRGIGKQLYQALEKRLRQMGILNFYVCIAVPKTENDPFLTMDSCRFHEKMGFCEVGRFVSCANKFGRWYDMVWMYKPLGEHEDHPAQIKWG